MINFEIIIGENKYVIEKAYAQVEISLWSLLKPAGLINENFL